MPPLVDAGWSSLVARRAHNPKVVGSNPAPATTTGETRRLVVCVDGAQGSYEGWLRAIIRTREADGQRPLAHSAQAAGRVAQTRWALGPFFVPAILGKARRTGYEC